jgi:hypothetical protein
LKDVIHAPEMVFTLISISRLDDAGCCALFGNGTCALKGADGKFFAQVGKTGGLYRIAIEAPTRPEPSANTVVRKMSLAEAHRVLGHISYGAVKHAIKSGQISRIQIDENSDEVFCDACAKAKPHRKPFPEPS